jgi:hypothetical protein
MRAMFGMPTQRTSMTRSARSPNSERSLRRLRDEMARAAAGADIARPATRRSRAAKREARHAQRGRRPHRPNPAGKGAAMNGPFDFSPAGAARESNAGAGQAGAGLGTPARGSTTSPMARPEREEVWRDGKVVLYRFRGETEPDGEGACADQLRAGQPARTWSTCSRPVDRQGPAGTRRGRLHHRLGLSGSSDRYLTLEDYIERFLGRRGRPPALGIQARRDQPARHLPGRRVLAVLRVAASGQGQEPDHHGHAGGLPHRRQHAVELGARPGRGPVRRHARQRAA